jgi:hypothetical protein
VDDGNIMDVDKYGSPLDANNLYHGGGCPSSTKPSTTTSCNKTDECPCLDGQYLHANGSCKEKSGANIWGAKANNKVCKHTKTCINSGACDKGRNGDRAAARTAAKADCEKDSGCFGISQVAYDCDSFGGNCRTKVKLCTSAEKKSKSGNNHVYLITRHNQCTCTNGPASTDSACTADGAHSCSSCSDGFFMRNNMCVECSNVGTCTNGSTFRSATCDSSTQGYQCQTCSFKSCDSGTYRTGTCSGTTNGYQCNTCSNASCPNGKYRTGTCSGTTNDYKCKTCDFNSCGSMKQVGSCSGTNNGFSCVEYSYSWGSLKNKKKCKKTTGNQMASESAAKDACQDTSNCVGLERGGNNKWKMCTSTTTQKSNNRKVRLLNRN